MAAEAGATGLEFVDTGGLARTSNGKLGLGDDESSRCHSKPPSNASASS